MSFFGDLISTVFERRYRSASSSDGDKRTIKELCEALLGNSGEVSGFALARKILDRYAKFTPEEKHGFLDYITHELGIEPETVISSLAAYRENATKESYQAFAEASEPKRQELIRRLNQVPGATPRLVAMRKDLLDFIPKHPDLEPLDVDFRHLFKSWFNRGFLVLRPINWESPASILEKIIAYESVHAIDSWEDLRLRLKPADRRCFGFFHPSMSDEPLIFVEVALTRGIPNSIQKLLLDERDQIDAVHANTAVFYSISNCQAGLAGISFGNSLIKQVVSDLSKELPGIATFVTLSPIPSLLKWISTQEDLQGQEIEIEALAAYYLLEAKGPTGMPYDPVARFHLGNGAMVQAVHAKADLSQNGLKQSKGVMVNYLYAPEKIAQNHELFVTEKKVVASKEVKALSTKIKNKKSGA